jgi:hypothetical protein
MPPSWVSSLFRAIVFTEATVTSKKKGQEAMAVFICSKYPPSSAPVPHYTSPEKKYQTFSIDRGRLTERQQGKASPKNNFTFHPGVLAD